MNRIVIFGPSGSGKSTLANRLGTITSLPVYHLDKIYWTKGWKERFFSKEKFNYNVESIASEDKWIIDGNYRSTLDLRLEKSDTIIFLDISKWKCIWRVFKRLTEKPYDKEEGMKNKIDWKLLMWIWQYNLAYFKEKALKYSSEKKVYIVRSRKDLKSLYTEISLLNKK